jgi:ABC-2 type transport system ATP-binding protein
VFGLLGPNGAGKTTTLHLLLDFIDPTSGVALLFGRPASDPRTRARVGYLPESLSLHGYYRGDDLLDFYGALLEMAPAVRRERAAALLRLLDLESVARRRVATYSKGTLQRLGFAQALLNDPDLLILDEPTSSLDPLARRRFSEILRELKARGKTILISSHLLSEVETICDRVAILKDGELARSGRLDDLLATPAVRIRVRRVPSALIDEVVGLGAEVGLAGDETTVRCRDAKTRDAVIAILEANGVHVDGTEAETRSLEGLFVEMMAG